MKNEICLKKSMVARVLTVCAVAVATLTAGNLPLQAQTRPNRPNAQGVSKTWSKLAPADLLRALRGGGYVFLFRHGQTDWRSGDQLPQTSFDNRATQRQLSPAGIQQARDIGAIFRSLKIPVGQIYSSPYFRCRDFAELAFGKPEVTYKLLGHSEAGRRGHVELFSEIPAKGTNRILAGHQFAVLAMGIFKVNELEEGSCGIFKAGGDGKYELIAHQNFNDLKKLQDLK